MDKALKDGAYEVALNPKYKGYQRRLISMVYKFFDKNIGSGMNVNELLAQELYKLVIKKFKRRKVYARFKENICVADLTEMGSLSSNNRVVKYLLCVADVFTKYAWVKHLFKTVPHGFIGIINESKHQPNNLWVDQGKELYNSPIPNG